MEYTNDELTSMAVALCAAYHEITYTSARTVIEIPFSESRLLWRKVAQSAFHHLGYIQHDRNVAMMDAEMGLG